MTAQKIWSLKLFYISCFRKMQHGSLQFWESKPYCPSSSPHYQGLITAEKIWESNGNRKEREFFNSIVTMKLVECILWSKSEQHWDEFANKS